MPIVWRRDYGDRDRHLRRSGPGDDRLCGPAGRGGIHGTACAPRVEGGEWYLVAFRSVHREGADEQVLEEYDLRAAEEAAEAPGFVRYFRGPVTSTRECLSFCIWESRDDARAASRGPRHIEAIALVEQMYERYELEFHRLTKRAGTDGLEFEPYDVLTGA